MPSAMRKSLYDNEEPGWPTECRRVMSEKLGRSF
jgi:hypothetical protein